MLRRPKLTVLVALVVALFAILPAAAGSAAPYDARGVNPASPNPLLGLSFFVDHKNPAWRQWRHFRNTGHKYKAAMTYKVASQPKFKWFGRWERHPSGAVRKFIHRSERRGQVPLLAVLRAQAKGCHHGYTGGNRREDSRTRKWYRRFAHGIGNHRVVIGFEPDSLGTLDCQTKHRRKVRVKLLRYGVEQFAKRPNATVYIEGGASDWESAGRTAKLLRQVGISKVRGFMLNVTHYDWTASNLAYGRKVSAFTGGKHFIVSTAFNGRGAVHYRRYRSKHKYARINVWCHPLKRGLGPAPTTSTAYPAKADAYMWIGRPGYSGGSCNGGPLPVGSWWAARAIMFGQYATNWIRPPAGTRYGLFKHYSLRALGG